MVGEAGRKYRIGDVSRLLNLPAYILRYWETEFPQLKPEKSATGQRLYTESDIQVLRQIASLRYDDKLTLSGARQKMHDPSCLKTTIPPNLIRQLQAIKNSLQAILADLR